MIKSKNLTALQWISSRNLHSCFASKDNNATFSASNMSEVDNILLHGKEIESLTTQILKDELGKRNLPKKGNKQALITRLKSSLLTVSWKTMVAPDQSNLACIDLDAINDTKKCDCPCLPLLLDLEKEMDEIESQLQLQQDVANRSESTFGDVKRIFKLQEENSELWSHLCSLKEQYELVVHERDSLKLVLQLVSKDLYFQSKKNEDKDKPCVSLMKVQKAPDTNANSSQMPLPTKCSKSQTPLLTKHKKSNTKILH